MARIELEDIFRFDYFRHHRPPKVGQLFIGEHEDQVERSCGGLDIDRVEPPLYWLQRLIERVERNRKKLFKPLDENLYPEWRFVVPNQSSRLILTAEHALLLDKYANQGLNQFWPSGRAHLSMQQCFVICTV